MMRRFQSSLPVAGERVSLSATSHAWDWKFQSSLPVAGERVHYQLVRPPGENWRPKTWKRLEPIWAEVERDAKRRLAAALSAGRIAPDQASVLLEHLIWTEVDARARIGYSRGVRSDQ